MQYHSFVRGACVWSASGGLVIGICLSTRSTLRLSTGWLRVVSPSTLLRTVSLLKIPSLSRWSNGRFDTRYENFNSSVSSSFPIQHSMLDVRCSMFVLSVFDVHPSNISSALASTCCGSIILRHRLSPSQGDLR